MRRFIKQVWQRLWEESGANQIVVLTICLGALLIAPVLFDFASVYYGRRTAQTGSDAAVLAAAKDYAMALSIEWTGICAEPPPVVVGRYLVYVQQVGWSPLGRGSAEAYARANNNRLTLYQNYFNGRYTTVDGVPIPHIEIYGETEKDIHLLVEYGQDYEAPARANSVAYLDDHQRFEIPCTYAGEPNVLYIYRFFWKIRLVR